MTSETKLLSDPGRIYRRIAEFLESFMTQQDIVDARAKQPLFVTLLSQLVVDNDLRWQDWSQHAILQSINLWKTYKDPKKPAKPKGPAKLTAPSPSEFGTTLHKRYAEAKPTQGYGVCKMDVVNPPMRLGDSEPSNPSPGSTHFLELVHRMTGSLYPYLKCPENCEFCQLGVEKIYLDEFDLKGHDALGFWFKPDVVSYKCSALLG